MGDENKVSPLPTYKLKEIVAKDLKNNPQNRSELLVAYREMVKQVNEME